MILVPGHAQRMIQTREAVAKTVIYILISDLNDLLTKGNFRKKSLCQREMFTE